MSSRQPRPTRYCEIAFPPYRHLPGETPHPERNAAGHMYGQDRSTTGAWEPERWRENGQYLYGVDLFNYGFWWEAHAQWEELWKETGPTDPARSFLQGLIQVSASLLKLRVGRSAGAHRLASKGVRKLRRVADEADSDRFMGLDTRRFAGRVEAFMALYPGPDSDPPILELG